jgi:hypothetical protein
VESSWHLTRSHLVRVLQQRILTLHNFSSKRLYLIGLRRRRRSARGVIPEQSLY